MKDRNYFLSNLAAVWISSGTIRTPRDAKTIRNVFGTIEYIRLFEGKDSELISFEVRINLP